MVFNVLFGSKLRPAMSHAAHRVLLRAGLAYGKAAPSKYGSLAKGASMAISLGAACHYGTRGVSNVTECVDLGPAAAKSNAPGGKSKVVDFRSDTLTSPTEEMRDAMRNAEVGDDVFLEDPTIIKLEEYAAKLFGKEAALFVTGGTQGNLISICVQCERGSEVLCGEMAHTFIWEQGGMAQVGGVHPRPVKQLPDGRLDLDDLKSKVRGDNEHFPITKLVCIENTFFGRVLKPDYIKQVAAFCKEKGLKLHCDGARIFNAAVALNMPVSEVTKDIDTLSFCVSKGLGAPVGAIVVGNKEFIRKARRMRKCLGAGMRQVGVLGAAAQLALEQGPDRMKKDHENCKRLAEGLSKLPGVATMIEPDSNMLLFSLSEKVGPMKDFVANCASQDGACCVKLLQTASDLPMLPGERNVRMVLYHQISTEDVDLALAKMDQVLSQAVNKQTLSNTKSTWWANFGLQRMTQSA